MAHCDVGEPGPALGKLGAHAGAGPERLDLGCGGERAPPWTTHQTGSLSQRQLQLEHLLSTEDISESHCYVTEVLDLIHPLNSTVAPVLPGEVTLMIAIAQLSSMKMPRFSLRGSSR